MHLGVAVPSFFDCTVSMRMHACSVVSDALRPRGLLPTRLLCPWHFPGKNTGVACHFLLQGIFPAGDQTPVSCGSCTGKQIRYLLGHLNSQWALLTWNFLSLSFRNVSYVSPLMLYFCFLLCKSCESNVEASKKRALSQSEQAAMIN